MNPSPEALAAAARLVSRKAVEAYGPNAGLAVADVIDNALAPYREQVRRLVEASREMDVLMQLAGVLEHRHRTGEREAVTPTDRLLAAAKNAASELDHAASLIDSVDEAVIEELDAAIEEFEKESLKRCES